MVTDNQTVFDKVPFAVIEIDDNDKIIYVNDYFVDILLISKKHILQKTPKEIFLEKLPDSGSYEFKLKKGSITFSVKQQPIKETKSIRYFLFEQPKQGDSKNTLKPESFFENIIASTPACIYAKNENGEFIYANAETAKLYNLAPGDLLGKKETDFIFPNKANLKEVQDIVKIDKKVINEGEKIFLPEMKFTKPNGDVRWLQTSKIPYMIEKSKQVLGISVDITERIKDRLKSAREENLLRQILDLVPFFLSAKNINGEFVLLNKAMAEFYGSTQKKLVGKRIQDIRPDEKNSTIDVQVIETGRSEYKSEEIFIDSESMEKFFQTTRIPFDYNGETVVLMIGVDITEQKRAKSQIIKIENRFRELTNLLPQAVFETDQTGNLTYVNQTGFNMFGYDYQDFNNNINFLDTIIPEDRERAQINMVRRQEGNALGSLEYTAKRKDGTTFPIMIYANPIIEKDQVKGVRGICIDITERIEYENKLHEAKASAERANQAQTTFLANMSHEIRTPMNGILGLTSLVLETDLSEMQKEYIETIKKSGDSLLRILNQFLDFAKIDSGKLELEDSFFSIQNLVEEILQTFSMQARKIGVKYISKIDKSVPAKVFGDPDRLRQVLMNLVNNAQKFTREGKVEVFCRAVSLGADRLDVQFKVRDTGDGIPEDKQKLIFEAFSQADSSFTRTHGGTGLGLAICKQLVDLMGGSISVESTIGQGSCFSFNVIFKAGQSDYEFLPNNNAPTNEANDLKDEKVEIKTILIAEDDSTNLKVAKGAFSKFNFEVLTAENGKLALELLETNKIDMVFMDIQMPIIDGIKATQLIRKSDGKKYNSDLPIIAMTAHALTGDRERFLKSGMDDYIAKPIKVEELERVLGRFSHINLSQKKLETAKEKQIERLESFDSQFLLDQVAGDLNLFKEIVQHFARENKKTDEEISALFEKQGYEKLEKRLHKLKGASGNIGASALKSIVFRMEMLVRKGEAVEAKEMLEKMNTLLQKIVQEIESTFN